MKSISVSFMCMILFCFEVSAEEFNRVQDFHSWSRGYVNALDDIDRMEGISRKERRRRYSNLDRRYEQERVEDYQAYRVVKQLGQSQTVGSSGKRKRSDHRLECPRNTVVDSHKFVTARGGCYGKDGGSNYVAFRVSQSGKGRSNCVMQVTCKYSDSYILSKVAREMDRLQNLDN